MNRPGFRSFLDGRVPEHRSVIVAALIFLVTALLCWRGYVEVHEAMYFLGPQRLLDPDLLANDISWGNLPPSMFLYNNLIAPFWNLLGDLGVATAGRLLYWSLTAWSLALLGRLMRLPPWAVVIGYALWLLADQTLVSCGRPVEGFQPKALSYPLFYFSLALAMQGRAVPAGVTAGLSTAFHLVVGGWGCLAVFCSMLLSRHPLRKLLGFLLAAAPFTVPVVVVMARFNVGQSTAEEQALMDKIYVTFAGPHCLDLMFFMSPERWTISIATFVLTPILFYLRPREKGGRMPAQFVLVLIGLYAVGAVANALDAYGFLKLFPFQLANSIPFLFLCIFTVACFGSERPKRVVGKVVWIAAVVLCVWVAYQEDAARELLRAPGRMKFRAYHPGRALSYGNRSVPVHVYEWIRKETPKDSIFITPHLGEFWVCTGRAQVASMRHPPWDRQLIEWEQRLIALNRGKPFEERGLDIEEELDENEGRLSVEELVKLRDRYDATYYLVKERRQDLDAYRLFSSGEYHLYGLADLE